MDDEPYVSISGGGTVTEGNTGTTAMTFTVTLSAASDAPVTVTYATADGSATRRRRLPGHVRHADLRRRARRARPSPSLVNGDRLGESDEYFYVNLTGATGAAISQRHGLRDHPGQRAAHQHQQT